ncbi:MAG: hypothetical protein FJX57_25560, partial [Alphaproteobacteria bacterium]|nr:hypothetical protein [Alphaproteobacteria bacterium]
MARMCRRVGVLVAGSDMVLEKDFASFIPAGVSFHVGRLDQDRDAKCAANTSLGKMVASAESAASLLAMAEPEAMIFACSSASFYKGPGWDKKVAARVRKGGMVPATTTATAIADGLKALGAKRTVLVTPYPDATNRAEIAFLHGNGIEVADYSTFGCRLSTDVPRVTPAEIRRRVLDGMKKVPDCDAVIVTCTNLRAMQIAEDLEKEVGRPVVTSNAASLWALLRLAGIATHS